MHVTLSCTEVQAEIAKPPGRKGVLSKTPAQCPNQKTNVATLISMTQRVPSGLWFLGLGLGTHLAPPIKTPHMVGPTEALWPRTLAFPRTPFRPGAPQGAWGYFTSDW